MGRVIGGKLQLYIFGRITDDDNYSAKQYGESSKARDGTTI